MRGELSQIMKQYADLKQKHPDAVLLFRRGDSYEAYGTDAEKVSEKCGIALSGAGLNSIVASVSFPNKDIDINLPKLVRAGYRIAICDILQPPKATVKRGATELSIPFEQTK